MRVGMYGENLFERLALSAGRAPVPLAETFFALAAARTIMAAARIGVFAALEAGPKTSAEIAALTGSDPEAVDKLLRALSASRYLSSKKGKFGLTSMARRWLLPGGPESLHDSILWSYVEWSAMEHYEDYLRTGKPMDPHKAEDDPIWEKYQLGMRSRSSLWVDEAVRRTPSPARAETMLDIGGSHGRLAARFCRKYPGLRATVLDLEQAVRQSARLLEEEGLGDRLKHEIGDALTADLGTEKWDIVFAAHLLHHFRGADCETLMRRVAAALRPGGVAAVFDIERPEKACQGGQFGALMSLYFAALSGSGTWSASEIAGWQSAAGLKPAKPSRFRKAPGCVLQAALKPSA